jgi:hypothetical protein
MKIEKGASMSNAFDSLSAADQADLLHRLAIFGLNETSFVQRDLFIPPNTTVTLSAGPGSFLQPYLLETEDLNELKRWIGTPDKYFEKHGVKDPTRHARRDSLTSQRLREIAAGKSIESRVELDEVHAAAIAYIWGNSEKVREFKPDLDRTFRRYQVVLWPFFTITVCRGAVLELGPGANVLLAWKIIIEEGGEVRGNSTNLTVQCTILQKELLFIRPFGNSPVRLVNNL